MTLTNVFAKSVIVAGASFVLSYFSTTIFTGDVPLSQPAGIVGPNGATSNAALPSVLASSPFVVSQSGAAGPSVPGSSPFVVSQSGAAGPSVPGSSPLVVSQSGAAVLSVPGSSPFVVSQSGAAVPSVPGSSPLVVSQSGAAVPSVPGSSPVASQSNAASSSFVEESGLGGSTSLLAGPYVLVFSKTTGYRHKSIEAGKAAFTKMAGEKKFEVEFTEDAGQFTADNLKRFKAVVFLNTTGDVLNNDQQAVFEKFIQGGGGYLGIHSATDCEYDWPWYGKLAGAYFLSHPGPKNVLNGKFYVVDKNHPSTKGMPAEFERSDEFYSFKQINPAIKVLIKIDEKSYEGGKNGDNHPMSWYHDYDGGRAFYTAMGHTDETFSEPLFLNHVYAGLQYAMGK